MTTPLFESDHPYYCSEGNYFARDCHSHHETWESFIEEEGESDMDYNLVYRWDWNRAQDDDEKPRETPADAREDRLVLFYMGQRKAAARSVSVSVCRNDEPAVRAWLAVRWEHLRRLWTPFTVDPVT